VSRAFLNNEIYISVDVETDGPIPGPNSMLSLGAAAYRIEIVNGKLVPVLLDTFSMNIEQLWDAKPDPETEAWWKTQPAAWEACRKDLQKPGIVMKLFSQWVEETSKEANAKPVFVGYPAGFDFLFVYWYLIRFVGKSPFSFSALDVKTFAMAVLGTEYRNSTKRNMPKGWFPKVRHNHIAVDDAAEQGELFCNMFIDNYRRRKPNTTL
jgi:hypothetical protein